MNDKQGELLLTPAVIDTRLCNYAINFTPEDMVQILKICEYQLAVALPIIEKWEREKILDDCISKLQACVSFYAVAGKVKIEDLQDLIVDWQALKEVDALRKVLTGLGNSILPGENKD